MAHQCVHCGKLYPDAAKELLTGCSCGSRFFYFIKKEYYDKLRAQNSRPLLDNESKQDRFVQDMVGEFQQKVQAIDQMDKIKIEKDVREIIGISEKEDIPVILDLESIRVLGPGKFEIDVVNLFSKKRPLIYKLEEGKYIIDLASTFRINARELDEKAREFERENKIKQKNKKR
jgi:predicted  nucleic acid-binding Zn-ribbon protein